jgi:hypothetical protein
MGSGAPASALGIERCTQPFLLFWTDIIVGENRDATLVMAGDDGKAHCKDNTNQNNTTEHDDSNSFASSQRGLENPQTPHANQEPKSVQQIFFLENQGSTPVPFQNETKPHSQTIQQLNKV